MSYRSIGQRLPINSHSSALNSGNSRGLFERLEPRVLLCGTPAEMIAHGVPASMIMSDGHITYSDFQTLPPKVQAHIDPHMVQSQLSEQPIDWEKVMGRPLHMDGQP